MSKINKVYHKIDQFFFKSVEQFEQSPIYQSTANALSAIDENGQKALSQISSLAFLIVPLTPLLILVYFTSVKNDEVVLKEKLLRSIEENVLTNQALSFGQGQILSPQNISSQPGLNSKLRSLLNSAGISARKVSIKSFELIPLGKISKATATLVVNDLTQEGLNTVLQGLVSRYKARTFSLDFVRDDKAKTLKGELKVLFFNKSN